MDDIEMDILEMEMEFQEIMQEKENQARKKPDWWLIALGAKDASREVYEKSRQIHGSFIRFKFNDPNMDFFEMVDLFTAAMVTNKVSI